MKRRSRLLGTVVALGAATALALTACSSDSDDAPAASDPAATEILTKAADSTAELTGAHLKITVDGTIQAINATGVTAEVNTKPDVSGKGTATLNMGGTKVEAPFVYLDDSFYANVNDDGWTDYGDGRSIFNVADVLNSDTGVPNILRTMEGAKTEGNEQVDGVSTTKVTGTVPAKSVAALIGATGKDAKESTQPLAATVWVTDQDQVARVFFEPAENTTMTIDISDWNSSVEVTKPTGITAPTEKPTSPPPSGDPTTLPSDG